MYTNRHHTIVFAQTKQAQLQAIHYSQVVV